jgi:EAL and modified HD-GYP domain-containing signal transduction protein
MTVHEGNAAVPVTSGDEVFVARQPIFDTDQKLFAYELLYRSSLNNSCGPADGTSATLTVLRDAFLLLGTQLTGTTRAFINFNLDLLKKRVPHSLRAENTVIEILEDSTDDPVVVDLCIELKREGYTIALDDFTPRNEIVAGLLRLADIIKVDFREVTVAEQADIMRQYAGKGIQFLAEKVETPEEFAEARRLGYRYFQGYFFGKPHIVSARNIPGNKLVYLRMLNEINRPDMDFPSLEGVIKRDTYLTYALLNYINSAYFGLRGRVGSIMQALSLLGEREVRRWASLVILTFLGADKPSEVSVLSLVRAKFCELLAMKVKLAEKASELFMTGMFSMLDVLVGRPLDEVLNTINVAEEIKVALTTGGNRYGDVLSLVLAYEKAAWDEVDALADAVGLDKRKLPSDYGTSAEWAARVFDVKVPGSGAAKAPRPVQQVV